MHDIGYALVFLSVAVLGIFLYFIPSVIAYSHNKKNAIGVLMLNIFLGWTIIGWGAALIWSFVDKEN